MQRQTQSYSIAPGHWAESAPLTVISEASPFPHHASDGPRLQYFFFANGGSESVSSHKERTRGSADTEGKPLPMPKLIASDHTALSGRIPSIRLFVQAFALQDASDKIPDELSLTGNYGRLSGRRVKQARMRFELSTMFLQSLRRSGAFPSQISSASCYR